MEFPRQHLSKRRDRNRDQNRHREGHFNPQGRNVRRESHFEPHDRDRRGESHFDPNDREPGMYNQIDLENTGAEPEYLKSLVDSRAKVTVVLRTGERLEGRIRYYDSDCFSIGLSAHGPRLFLRKDSVSYIAEN
jgi:sRNA-binding regulator protein Hfq